jgi:molybdopterin-containing oxidoreductase family iron-sulfur binding subunit
MTERGAPSLDLATLRAQLARQRGPRYWRSLDELAQTPSFLTLLQQEFPAFARIAEAAIDRRRVLQLMAASLALGGLTGCQKEVDQRALAPYVEQPPGIVPGRARYYATATSLDGFGYGVLLRHEMGRPLKVEGNPDHPASLGSTSAIGQASILGLYDPHRAQSITAQGELASSKSLATMLAERRDALRAHGGAGLRLLTGAVTSPTLAEQIASLQKAFPAMVWHQWEPLHRDAMRAGADVAFGRAIDTVYDFSRADVILGIESDALNAAPGHLRYARDFAARRRADRAKTRMSRVYALESTPTLLGAKADHRLVMRPQEIAAALRFIAGSVQAGPAAWKSTEAPQTEELAALIGDLEAHRGTALLHPGREQPAEIHALCHAINHALGGETARAIEPIEASPTSHASSLGALATDMQAGKVDTLLILGVNAAYTAPADLDFAGALKHVPHAIYLGLYDDETAELCQWQIPAAHEYESWSDIRAYDGTVTIQQPQVKPLYGGHSAHEILAMLLGATQPSDYALLRAHWQHASGAGDFESFWTDALRAGVVPSSAAPKAQVALRPDYAARLQQTTASPSPLTVLYRPDPGLWDGRFAENGWLQEMSRPFTRLTWDNAAELAPATAAHLNLREGDVVSIALDGRRLDVPVWILPGQAEDCVTLRLGYGRRRAGPVGTGIGANAYLLRGKDQPWQTGATLTKTSARYRFASEQNEALMQGHELIRETELTTFLEQPQSLKHSSDTSSLYPSHPYDGIAWAMSISLNACIGCQACVIACQAENNIPVVGKEEVGHGRVMHWLRIDRYYSGDLDRPDMHFQPVPCMHCENAPCEVVCPVQATVHDSEGLNVMVYNRCVGTRFCSNNCPYKVRRFNWLDFTHDGSRPRASWNPDVTVRGRGVMEKCTYCVQRTRQAMIESDKQNSDAPVKAVQTACQQACPTEAIVFGDKNDKASAVAQRKASVLDYPILDELNTRPRTTYEMAVRNPHPKIKAS